MRKAPNDRINKYRVRYGPKASDDSYGNNGCFIVKIPSATLGVIASDGCGWDHVSVSVLKSQGQHQRLPTWDELVTVKAMFFDDDEAVIHYVPKKADHISNAEVMHLWRPQTEALPIPPRGMIGVPDVKDSPGGDGDGCSILLVELDREDTEALKKLAGLAGNMELFLAELVRAAIRDTAKRVKTGPVDAYEQVAT